MDARSCRPSPLGHLRAGDAPGRARASRRGRSRRVSRSTPSGARLVVAHHENDALTVVDLAGAARGGGRSAPADGAGGEFPLAVVVVGEARALVASQRDREARRGGPGGGTPSSRRIPVGAAAGGARREPRRAPASTSPTPGRTRSASSTSPPGREIARRPDDRPAGRRPADAPAAARVEPQRARALARRAHPLRHQRRQQHARRRRARSRPAAPGGVVGPGPDRLLPHRGLPSRATAAGSTSRTLSSVPGPNPHGPWSDAALAPAHPYAPNGGNEYALQLEHGGLLALPRPDAGRRSRSSRAQASPTTSPPTPRSSRRSSSALRGVVKHVVFVVGREPHLRPGARRPAAAPTATRASCTGATPLTPNQHALAQPLRRRSTASSRRATSRATAGSGRWAARTTDVAEKAIPVEYADRGHHTYDWEGLNRGINVGLATDDERVAFEPHARRAGSCRAPWTSPRPDALLWDAALAAGKSVRAYGVFCDLTRYGCARERPGARAAPAHAVRDEHPRRLPGARVAPGHRGPVLPRLRHALPGRLARGRVAARARRLRGARRPAGALARAPAADHLGTFGDAIDGVDTPDTQMADHDWALGRPGRGALAHAVLGEHRRLRRRGRRAERLGPRGLAPDDRARGRWAREARGAVVHTPYTTTELLRTIELLLGLAPLGQHDAEAPADGRTCFDETRGPDAVRRASSRTCFARRSSRCRRRRPGEHATAPRHDAAWWAAATAGFDFDAHRRGAGGSDEPRPLCGLLVETRVRERRSERTTCRGSRRTPR